MWRYPTLKFTHFEGRDNLWKQLFLLVPHSALGSEHLTVWQCDHFFRNITPYSVLETGLYLICTNACSFRSLLWMSSWLLEVKYLRCLGSLGTLPVESQAVYPGGRVVANCKMNIKIWLKMMMRVLVNSRSREVWEDTVRHSCAKEVTSSPSWMSELSYCEVVREKNWYIFKLWLLGQHQPTIRPIHQSVGGDELQRVNDIASPALDYEDASPGVEAKLGQTASGASVVLPKHTSVCHLTYNYIAPGPSSACSVTLILSTDEPLPTSMPAIPLPWPDSSHWSSSVQWLPPEPPKGPLSTACLLELLMMFLMLRERQRWRWRSSSSRAMARLWHTVWLTRTYVSLISPVHPQWARRFVHCQLRQADNKCTKEPHTGGNFMFKLLNPGSIQSGYTVVCG